MDDLNDDPQKVAEDIIDQATKDFKFRQSAIDRIILILESYHQLKQENAVPKVQQKTESDIVIDGSFAWKVIQGQKQGPYCAACYTKTQGKDFIRLINVINHSGTCAKCGMFCYDSEYDEFNGFDVQDSGHHSWFGDIQ